MNNLAVMHSFLQLLVKQVRWEFVGAFALNFFRMKQSLFYFSGAGKFCLAHGLRQLTRNVQSDVRLVNFRSDMRFH